MTSTKYRTSQKTFLQVGIRLRYPIILFFTLVMLSCTCGLFNQESSPESGNDSSQQQSSETLPVSQEPHEVNSIAINQDKIPQSVVMSPINFPHQLTQEEASWWNWDDPPPTIGEFRHLVSQDGRRLWTIASGGLATYGSRGADTGWRLVTPQDDGLAHDAVTDLALDKQGGVWATTWWGISHFSDDKWKTFNSDGDLKGNVFSVAVDSNNVAWFGGPAGAARFDGNYWTFYTTDDGLPDNTVLDIAIGPDDAVWFITKYGGLARLNKDDWEAFETPFDLSDDLSSPRLLVDNDSTVWLGTSYGLASFDGNSWQNWTNVPIYSIISDDAGQVWAGGFDAVHRFDGNLWSTFSVFPEREITGITFDQVLMFTSRNKLHILNVSTENIPSEVEIIQGDLRLPDLPSELLTFADKQDYADEIFGLDMENGNILNLTQIDQGIVSDPVWSPTGQELIFRISNGFPNQGELYFHKIGQRTSTKLTNNLAMNDTGMNWCCAAWSFDGKYVSYVGNSNNYNNENYDVGNGNVFVQDVTTGMLDRYNLDYQDYFYLGWSPVENKLAAFQAIDTRILPYYGYSKWFVENPDIRVYDATSYGKEYRTFTSSHAGINQPFDWSPDGQWLAYVNGGRYGNSFIVIDEIYGNGSKKISSDFSLFLPDWHPAGEKIAYYGKNGSEHIVYIQNVSNDQIEDEVPFNGEVIALKWSPNGKWLAVVSDQAENSNYQAWHISVLDATKNYEVAIEHRLSIELEDFSTESYVNQIQWRPQ